MVCMYVVAEIGQPTIICNFERNLFSVKNFMLIEFWPELAKMLGISLVNKNFEKV